MSFCIFNQHCLRADGTQKAATSNAVAEMRNVIRSTLSGLLTYSAFASGFTGGYSHLTTSWSANP
jgi:hypothetical protein